MFSSRTGFSFRLGGAYSRENLVYGDSAPVGERYGQRLREIDSDRERERGKVERYRETKRGPRQARITKNKQQEKANKQKHHKQSKTSYL